ncbi:acyltransferase [Aneurinibacillus thermoaerophilus]|uniref:acyltransferase family protein n=1 Tax=Aneurinibacillus thermoaerophilus TaxID=143495 RepID=UPI002E1EE6EB|nr:acyltransferase [Aneurinibacillus thermoaerophilus]
MRNLGLDIARSLAIVMVLISHGRAFFPNYDLQFLSINGYFGVELFFVLSGFLIGKIIVTEVLEQNSISNLKNFYVRRWFRTLPLYFLVVLFLFVIGRPFDIRSLIFLQNFSAESLGFIPVSWSLAIEEWFYLLIPFLILLLLNFWKSSKKNFFIFFCTVFILLETIARIVYVLKYNPSWDFGVRKQIFLRMDSLLIGVMLAGIKIYYKEIYDRVIQHSKSVFAVAVLGLIACGLYYVFVLEGGKEVINTSFFGRTLLFSLVSFFFALLIAVLEKSYFINNVLARTNLSKLFRFISLTSYAVYLIHYDIYHYFQTWTTVKGASSIELNFGYLIIAIVVTFSMASILYKYYELPIMKLRDKFSSKEYRGARLDTAVTK